MTGSPIHPAFARALRTVIDSLGVNAVIDGAAVKGDLTNGYISAAGVSTSAPVLEILDDDALTVTQRSVVVIGGTTYNIIAIEPTGQGTTQLVLSKD